MRAVLACKNDVVYVTFEKRLENPWDILAQVAQDYPEIVEKTVRFSRKIPESGSYVLWEMNGNSSPDMKKTADTKEAVRFLKSRRPLRTLGELLQKYASASK